MQNVSPFCIFDTIIILYLNKNKYVFIKYLEKKFARLVP